jgi:uncharacterized membrane protein YuzA (DUF378 family)
MWIVDHSTMIILILCGLDLGLNAVVGFSPIDDFVKGHSTAVDLVVGIAASWQLMRQRFPIPRDG